MQKYGNIQLRGTSDCVLGEQYLTVFLKYQKQYGDLKAQSV